MSKNRGITVAVETLGCKVNQAESEHLYRQFAAAGYRTVTPDQSADIYIVNTCTVTGMADSKARHLLRAIRRLHPNAFIIATGCYAERAAAELRQIESVDLVTGNADKEHLVQILEKSNLTPHFVYLRNELCRNGGRTRTFIKVQDGCSRFCAYCIVPLVRNHEEHMPPEQVIGEIKQRQIEGYKEVVITGVEVGSYNCKGLNIAGLLQHVLSETDIPRIRLSSLQPAEITEGLVKLWYDTRLCRHFHLSLQCGCNTVLQRMNRCYTTGDYTNAINLIRRNLPDVAVTTDIIVGFPGETDNEFSESLEFVEKTEFSRIHVFPFSARPGTEAAGLPHQIGTSVKKVRMEKMLGLADKGIKNFSEKLRGRSVPVLFEQKEGELWAGLTGNYVRVYTEAPADLTNRILDVDIGGTWKDGVTGRILKPLL